MVALLRPGPDVFEALGDPTRRQILDDLRAGPRRATDIAGDFSTSRQAVAKHLKVLERVGLVRVEHAGRERHYHLDGAPLAAVDHWLARHRLAWAKRLVDLKRHVESKRSRSGERR